MVQFASAQYTINGLVLDADDQKALSGATIGLTIGIGSDNLIGTVVNDSGKFVFSNLSNGAYLLVINYVGYKTIEQKFFLRDADKHLGTILLSKNSTTLNDVHIVEKQVRVEQKNDTVQYNASAFKTNKDASVEDLVTKMPGITNDNGTIKAHGEQVKKVLIDGKEYFGDDASLAMKNIPSDFVDKVQVFDQMGDQSFFTGFDDGNSQKAMNIVTKKGMNNGVFGKFYAGYGYINDSRYTIGASVNWFNGNRRLSFIGMSNNINVQNFSMQDIMSAAGISKNGMPQGGGRPQGKGGGGGGWMNNSGIQNFMVGQQNGISTTHAAGLNYTDVLGKKKNLKLTGSYFFNWMDNDNATDLTRQYFNHGDSSLYYIENNSTANRNINHRVNLRLEYLADSTNNFVFTPKFSYQQTEQTNFVDGQNSIAKIEPLSQTVSSYQSKNYAYNVSADLLYQHKFKKLYRTFSINLGTNINSKIGNTSQNAQNSFVQTNDSLLIDQRANSTGTSYKVYGNISYTEPAGKTGMVQLSYEPSYTWNKADKETFNRDTLIHEYSLVDTILSSKYDNDYMTHKLSASYRLKFEQFNFSIGVAGQYALLSGKNIFPYSFETKRTFYSILPNAQFVFRLPQNGTLKMVYRTSTNPPAINHLQSVFDNSNPLLLSTGNPDLKQSFNHFVMLRYGFTDTKTAQSFFLFTSANITQDYLANSTFIAVNDTLLNNSVLLRVGSQLSQPINLNGYINANAFLTYGLPITKIKCNLNLNAGFNYARTPSQINNVLNLSDNYSVTGGFTLGSNINEKIDFTLNYMGTYNIVKNTLQRKSDNNYYSHVAGAKINWQFWKGFVVNTSVQNTLYAGVSQGYNQNIFLWNASLAYKFLKDQSLELKGSVNDIMNQNSGVSRTVNETYIEDSKSKVLQRYWMLTLTYTLKQFKSSAK
ncbi:MAG: outer membrane beta-barrel protein [Bacteroidetes bacterium]|nr:outer membrane beta-barrel protein [Bacteroidota bacterium]